MGRRRSLAYAVALLVLAWCASARADAGTVSLLGVSGRGGSRFADDLEQDLAELYQLVPGEAYHRGAERIGQRGASPEEVHAVCAALRIDALIAGAVSGEGQARQLVMVTREGASGEVIARKRYDLSTHTLPIVREQVMSDLVRALERVRRFPRHGPIAARPVPRPVAPPREEEDEDDTVVAAETEPTTEIVHEAPRSEKQARGFFAAVGPAFMTRSLAFNSASAPGYSGGGVFAIAVEGGVFPLALSSELAEAHPVLASFGLLASYERALDLTSTVTGGQSVSGNASRWNARLVGRVSLGHDARGGTLGIEAGFQRISWSSTSPTLIGVPDVTYDLIVAGLSWDRALGTRYLELGVRIAAQGLVDGGAIMNPSQYGAGRGWGLDFEAGLTVRPTRWLWLRAAARYTPLFLSFRAEGARLASSASDRFADGTLEVGFAL